MSDRSFPSKLLLFGEYTVINGSEALALPFPKFSGKWEKNLANKYDWNSLLRFLEAHTDLLDVTRLEKDLGEGWGFTSSIPQGKGLGSSGALVAALFHTYSLQKDLSLQDIRSQLAELEGHYHGQSSGVDPLVSWVDQPLILSGAETPRMAQMPVEDWSKTSRWFLLDSGVARHSAPLVAVFKRKQADVKFQETLSTLESLVSECIEDYRNLDEAHMGLHMEELSRLQLSAFQEMIPEKLKEIWVQGLDSRQFALKLCGAGGGGYFLGYKLRGPLPEDVILL